MILRQCRRSSWSHRCLSGAFAGRASSCPWNNYSAFVQSRHYKKSYL
jgi:hypothetical protein